MAICMVVFTVFRGLRLQECCREFADVRCCNYIKFILFNKQSDARKYS